MPLFSFLPIAPPGEGNEIPENLIENRFNALPWILITSGVVLLILSFFFRTKKKFIYLSISILLVIVGIIFLIW